MNNTRLNSVSIVGGSFGDEGKGKVVDEICHTLIKRFDKVIVYRWNGGSNAGHTVEIQNKKFVLHQIPSGALIEGTTCILGKGMVIHPGDLVSELAVIQDNGDVKTEILIDEMTPLSLDTHRAFESSLKKKEEGGAGSTGRGISPAYADIIYRHPIRARDLLSKNWKEKFEKHYSLYRSLISGLGDELSKMQVNSLSGGVVEVGNKTKFIKNISEQRNQIGKYITNVYDLVQKNWNSKTPFVFEGAQGVGLDLRWGVYPDVTASDPTPSGIFSSTEGIVNPETIEIKANVYKATYTSSVGKRVLPTKMDEKLAAKIREDANEYGATTKRPRDIYHIDLPALSYFAKVSMATHMVLTHLDISYPDIPVKVCTQYVDKKGQLIDYRPDQEFLNHVLPVYESFKSWDGNKIKNCTNINDLSSSVRKYVKYISQSINLIPLMLTTGPKRKSVINSNYLLF
ncbi:MAG: adenylosuccinate synthetase [bacterium]|nr:adenylosuccinate synthetase [bacterium]